MKEVPKTVMILVGVMCLIRILMGGYAYFNPELLMEEWGDITNTMSQMPYMVRVWGIRDVVIGIWILLSPKKTIAMMLIGCAVIDGSDVLAAFLNYAAGATTAENTITLIGVALSCFIPETIALAVLKWKKA